MIEETSLFRYDEQLRREGYLSLCGVDEAGRGPLAGPVVAAAVILPEDALQRCPQLAVLNDSKKLSEEKAGGAVRAGQGDRLWVLASGRQAGRRSTSSTSCRPPFWRCAGRWSRWSSSSASDAGPCAGGRQPRPAPRACRPARWSRATEPAPASRRPRSWPR